MLSFVNGSTDFRLCDKGKPKIYRELVGQHRGFLTYTRAQLPPIEFASKAPANTSTSASSTMEEM